MRRAAALLAVVALCFSFSLTQLADPDFHWHLRAGQTILEQHRVPRLDTLSHPSAGRPWIDLQWLFEVAAALAFGWGGWDGLDFLKLGLIAGGFSLAALAAFRRTSAATVAALALPAILASQERFALRPEAASFLLLGALVLILESRRERPAVLALVPPLLALWANLHALYAVGLGLLVLVLAGDLVESRLLLRSGAEGGGLRPGPLALATALAFPATLLTPYGISAWALPLRLLTGRIAAGGLYGDSVAEFQAPFSGFGGTASIAAFGFLAAVVGAAVVANGRRLRPSDLLVLAAFYGLALLARRNIPLFALTALPFGAGAVESAARRAWERAVPRPSPARVRAARAVPALVAAAVLVVLADVWSNRFFARDGTQRYFGRGEAPGFYPEAAADFILAAAPGGEVVNDLTAGGYLAWRFAPGRRVFIDSRLEVHEEALYAAYLRLRQDPQTFESVARRYGVAAVVWSHRSCAGAGPLLKYLAGGHGWRPVFVDLAAVVFVREPRPDTASSAPQAIDLRAESLAGRILGEIEEAERHAAAMDPAPALLRRVLPRRQVPVAAVNAGLFFAIIGSPEVAEPLFRAALVRAPRHALLHYDLGLLLAAAGRDAEARRELEAALEYDGALAPARAALARLALRRGEAGEALRQWSAAERLGPLDPASLQLRGAWFARNGRLDEAIADYREALGRDPRRGDLRADLALLYRGRGLRELAAREAGRALEDDPGGCAPRTARARLLSADGEIDGAESSYRAILETDPSCNRARVGLAALLASAGRSEEAVREIARGLDGGLDPADLSAEPALRMLLDRPELRDRIAPHPRADEGDR